MPTTSSAATAQAGFDPFATLVKTHPRLMADPSAIAHVKQAIAGDPDGKKLYDYVIRHADELIPQPPVKYDPNNALDVSRTALKRIQQLGMAYLLTGDARYAARGKAELLAISGFPSWNPATHFLDTAEMTNAASIGSDWFYWTLNPTELTSVLTAIVELGLKPGLQQYIEDPDPQWPIRITNWNIVCNGGLMLGALAVAEFDPDIANQVFMRGLASVPTGIDGYAPDGTWDEGPGYWTYATEYLAYLLGSLKTALGHEFGLGDMSGVPHTGMFRLYAEGSAAADDEAGLLFNFSDSPEEHSGSWSMRWLSLRYNNPIYNRVALADAQQSAMDLLWFQPAAETPPIPADALFRGVANIAVMRGQGGVDSTQWQPWDRQHSDTTYLAIRAGRNTVENHHGHLDLGGFVLDSMQLRWATDIPPVDSATPPCVADYDLPGYFDVTGQRFTYYRTSTIGHNTLLVNGRNQPIECETDIIEFASDPEMAIAIVDLSPAYPDALRVQRGFALIDRRDVLIVDEITPRKPLAVTWQMHTRATINLAGTRAKLVQGSTPLYVDLLLPSAAVFGIGSTAVAPPQAPNTGISKLVVTLNSVPEATRLGVYFSPSPDAAAKPLHPLIAQPLWQWRIWARGRR